MTLTLDEGLFAYLRGHAGLFALVASRIFPDFFAQNETLPAIAFALEDDISDMTQQGPSSLRKAIYHIGVWADTAKDAMAVGSQLRFALDGYHGTFTDGLSPESTIRIPGSFLESFSRHRDPETGAFSVSTRFTIFYQEP